MNWMMVTNGIVSSQHKDNLYHNLMDVNIIV